MGPIAPLTKKKIETKVRENDMGVFLFKTGKKRDLIFLTRKRVNKMKTGRENRYPSFVRVTQTRRDLVSWLGTHVLRLSL